MLPIQRFFVNLFSGEDWLPLVQTKQSGVYASQWGQGDLRLWTLINRGAMPVQGPLLPAELQPGQECFDLVTGTRIKPRRGVLHGRIEARGIGCFLVVDPRARPTDLDALLSQQQDNHTTLSQDTVFFRSQARRVPVIPTYRFTSIPQGMVRVPGGDVTLKLEFMVREVGFYPAWTERPLTFPWLGEKTTFEHSVKLADFALDETPVTNRQYAEFLAQSGYRPRLETNFLKHWPQGKMPETLADHPVVYVTLEDARAYAAWAGKRLPTEYEWQYAAQGPDELAYPWGSEDDPCRRNGSEGTGTTPVRAYPDGRSPFGVYDLCGNTWELTESEHSDGRNRFFMLKGGSHYQARGSIWYFDGGAQPNRHVAKMLLFWPGLDRCATVGFRCAVDLA
jgi:formylglycine-generating enzyme required for sulfatase activity